MNTEVIFYSVCALTAAIMFIYIRRRRKWLSTAIFGIISGLAALFLINSFGDGFGVHIPLNIFNLSGSVVLGVPFVAAMVILGMF